MASSEKEKYIGSVGRRKMAIARVRITPGSKNVLTINDKPVSEYFSTKKLQAVAMEALDIVGLDKKFTVTVKIVGGGITSQAESIRLGIARALVKHSETLRLELKKKGFLKRDPRVKERRKFGLKKARKAPQWSKR
jgi:small subunit ribosomal protein S9